MITPTSARRPPSASSSALTQGSFAGPRFLPGMGPTMVGGWISSTAILAGRDAAPDFSTINSHPPYFSGRLHMIYLPLRQGLLSTPLPSASYSFDVPYRHGA